MTTSLEEFLEHHGIKGMRWGVRREDPSGSSSGGSKADAKAAKATAKADAKWLKKADTMSTYMKIYNEGADRINKNIDSFNKPYEGKDMSKPGPQQDAYYKAYAKFAEGHFNDAAKAYGTNPSGTQGIEFKFSSIDQGFPEANLVDIKHADLPKLSLSFDDKGLIKSVSVGALAHAELDTYLEHFGIKGMRWGVRRDNPSGAAPETSADVKKASAAAAKITKKGGTSALDNSELQALVNRMNLEQQYSTLSTKTQTKSLGVKFLQGTGKFAGNIAREQAKNAANMVLKQQVKKALKAKGLLD